MKLSRYLLGLSLLLTGLFMGCESTPSGKGAAKNKANGSACQVCPSSRKAKACSTSVEACSSKKAKSCSTSSEACASLKKSKGCGACAKGKSGQTLWCSSCQAGYVEGKKMKCSACYKGKVGGTAWCDSCGKGFVSGKAVKCKGCYEHKIGGPACKVCSPKK